MIILSVIFPVLASDTHYEMMGTVMMLVIVGIGVAILIMTGISSESYAEFEKREINMSFNDLQDTQNEYMKFKSKFGMSIAFGVFLMIIAVAMEYFVDELLGDQNFSGTILITCAAISVFIFIHVGVRDGMYRFLVQNQKYIQEQRKSEKSLYAITMPLAAMAYLVMGFVYGWWHPGWIIFLVTAIVTAGIEALRGKE